MAKSQHTLKMGDEYFTAYCVVLKINVQNWTDDPSPPDAVGMKSALAAQFAIEMEITEIRMTRDCV